MNLKNEYYDLHPLQKSEFGKYKSYITFILPAILMLATACAQNEEDIMSSFEKRVVTFKKFFSSKPKLLEGQYYKDSPTDRIFFYVRFDDPQITYNIYKTDSLVSPYMGYIDISYSFSEARKCGNAKGTLFYENFFSTIEFAREKKDDEGCYGEKRRDESKFIFAFQKKRWVFINLVSKDDNEHDVFFRLALGIPLKKEKYFDTSLSSSGFYVKDNDFWKKLIE